MNRKYNGKDILNMGIRSGPFVKDAIYIANWMNDEGCSWEEIREELLDKQEPMITLRDTPKDYFHFLEPENDLEVKNLMAVENAMREVMYSPVVMGGAILPDACPAGAAPVGSVIAVEGAIVPSYHSADVCCSVALTELDEDCDLKEVLDIIEEVTEWGPNVTNQYIKMEEEFFDGFGDNKFLRGLDLKARRDFGTQGDGNHFYYVGTRRSTGNVCIVSHHGSRGFGAEVFRRGMDEAFKQTKKYAKGIDKKHSWLRMDSDEGKHYWEALGVIREWTKRSHFDLHEFISYKLGCGIEDQFWNPHNFVFKKSDYFYHAKGATPNYNNHSFDDSGHTLIPLNMEEPILIAGHVNNITSHGFAPHGAGRNMSRTQFLKENPRVRKPHVDYRFSHERGDDSELPDAYKCAKKVTDEIVKYGLADIVDYVDPYGCVMAGDVEYDAWWRKKKREKDKNGKVDNT